MSRAFDFVVVGVIIIISVVIHLIGVQLFAPDAPLHVLASSGTEALNGAERADTWYQILAVWVPLGSSTCIMLWAFIREFRRQRATAASRRV